MIPAAIERRLRVLHLEDSELDHELTLAHMRRQGLDAQTHRIDSIEELRQALKLDWDIIVSDYNLPGFSGLTALEMVQASGRLIPFILVSGEIGEDTAVEAMRNGASDYLLKNNLTRLVPAMLHAIEANETRKAKLEADRELSESRRRVSELAQHLQTSIELERAAIAREIHDDVGGSLTALKFELAWIARHSDSEEVRQRVASAAETVTHAIESSQRIMHNLRPAILEQGLIAALQWMTNRFERRTNIVCVFRTSHEQLPSLPAGVALAAYRVSQEALTNVSKHAQATRVRIDVTLAGGVLSVEVSDNGRGLSQVDLAKARSFGIRGLHERASTVGGWVDLTSGDRGTTLIFSVPLSAEFLDSQAEAIARAGAIDHGDDPTAWGDL